MRYVLGAGRVRDIELVRRADKGQRNCRAFIHLTSWPSTGQGAAVRERLLSGKQVFVACRDATVWRCSAAYGRCSAAYGRSHRQGGLAHAGPPGQHNMGIS